MSDRFSSHQAKALHWRGVLAEQAVCGKTIREFCKEHQINRSTFQYWREKFYGTDQKVENKRPPSRFMAVARSNLSSKDAIPSRPVSPRIILPNGVTIDLGVGLDSTFASQFLLNLCGVCSAGGAHAKS